MTDTFLQINDQINTVLNRYEAFKKGDYVTSSNPIPAELGGSAKNDLSLIDFDDSAPSNNTASSSGPDDLMGLFGPPSTSTAQPSAFTSSPLPSNGYTPPSINQATRPISASSPMFTASPPQQHHHELGSIMLPGTPQPQRSGPASRVASPNYFGSVPQQGPAAPIGGMGAMNIQQLAAQSQPQQQSASSSQAQTGGQVKGKDPFADLVGLF